MMRVLQSKGNVRPLFATFFELAVSRTYEERKKYFRNPLL